MDLKVLAAVFITLFAVAVAMSQGSLKLDDLGGTLQGLEGAGDLPELLRQAEEASINNTVSGTLISGDPATFRIQTPARLRLYGGNISEVTVGTSEVRVQEDASLTVEGFRGTVELSPGNLSVDGTITGLSTPSFGFVYSSPKQFSVESSEPAIDILLLDRVPFQLSNATGSVSASGTTVQVDGGTAWFKGFTGNLSVSIPRYTLEGRFATAMVGEAEIG
ncbi:MAG: hypothetical protein ABEI07_02335 [Candidatus Nanohaloarchaea archaeon]